MRHAEVVVLVGKLIDRFHPGDLYRPAWERALAPLDDVGIAGTAMMRLVNAARPGNPPTIDDFLDLYRQLGGRVPSDGDRPLPPAPAPNVECPLCDRTGWVAADPLDHQAGSRPCTCPHGARVAPIHASMGDRRAAAPIAAVPPPWKQLGITAAEWQARQVAS